MINYIIAFICAILSGILTGLTPGIHINLIIALLTASTILTNNPTTAIIYITTLSITHTFLDFIPSIYLGAASEDSSLAILPGHKLLLQGNGHNAVIYTAIGSFIAIITLIVTIPAILYITKHHYIFINKMIGFILIWITITLLFHQNQNKKWSIIIFVLAGILGITTVSYHKDIMLLPLLGGLFGASTLINSIQRQTIIPEQHISKVKIKTKELIAPTIINAIISPICSLLPGIGSSQAATLSSKIRKTTTNQFLILLGAINTTIMAISFTTLYTINKSRTGSAKAIGEIITITPQLFSTITLTIIITAIIAFPLTIYISRICAKHIHKVEYQKISIFILTLLTTITVILSGYIGLLIYTTATAIGLLCIQTKTTKSHLMAAILLPTTLLYLPL